MPFQDFKDSVKRLIKVVSKPSRSEIWVSVKVSILGIGILGLIGFLIKLVGAIFLRAGAIP
ncbi:MAG: protein translocase SEC61 complex subunit gamma [Candidatus Bathyarchaeia archaeon]